MREARASAGWAHDNHFSPWPDWFEAVTGLGGLSLEAQQQVRVSLVRRQQQRSEAAQLEVAPATFVQSRVDPQSAKPPAAIEPVSSRAITTFRLSCGRFMELLGGGALIYILRGGRSAVQGDHLAQGCGGVIAMSSPTAWRIRAMAVASWPSAR